MLLSQNYVPKFVGLHIFHFVKYIHYYFVRLYPLKLLYEQIQKYSCPHVTYELIRTSDKYTSFLSTY